MTAISDAGLERLVPCGSYPCSRQDNQRVIPAQLKMQMMQMFGTNFRKLHPRPGVAGQIDQCDPRICREPSTDFAPLPVIICTTFPGTAIAPTKKGKADFQFIDKMDFAGKKEQLAAIDKLNHKGANIVSFTILQSLDEFLCYELTELLKQGLGVRKCRNCGQYFVLKSKHKTVCCDRAAGNDHSCKEIGNQLEYQKKPPENAALLRYKRIYKRRYSKMLRDEAKEVPTVDKSAARQKFLAWSESAKAARQQSLAGNISAENFERQLEKL